MHCEQLFLKYPHTPMYKASLNGGAVLEGNTSSLGFRVQGWGLTEKGCVSGWAPWISGFAPNVEPRLVLRTICIHPPALKEHALYPPLDMKSPELQMPGCARPRPQQSASATHCIFASSESWAGCADGSLHPLRRARLLAAHAL